MSDVEIALIVCLVAISGAGTIPVLRGLNAPVGADADVYTRLASARFAVIVVALTGLVAIWCALRSELWWWLAVAGPSVLAASIDARTRYLPRQLHLASLAALMTIPCYALVTGDSAPLLRAALAALASTATFWLLWRFARFGFGDVRLAGVLAASSAAHSWDAWFTGLLLGTTFGAAWGLIWRLSGRPHAFPYGPALVLGAVAGLGFA